MVWPEKKHFFSHTPFFTFTDFHFFEKPTNYRQFFLPLQKKKIQFFLAQILLKTESNWVKTGSKLSQIESKLVINESRKRQRIVKIVSKWNQKWVKKQCRKIQIDKEFWWIWQICIPFYHHPLSLDREFHFFLRWSKICASAFWIVVENCKVAKINENKNSMIFIPCAQLSRIFSKDVLDLLLRLQDGILFA